MADLFDDDGFRRAYADNTTYEYPGGRKVHRKPNKTGFPQSGNKEDRSLFHGDRVGDAATVYVTEGEKDALTIESSGRAAVCPPMGAGQKSETLAQYDWSVLKDKNVVIPADKDDRGHEHATQIATLLAGIAKSVQIVEAAEGKDPADHIAADRSLDELMPVEWWSPPQPVDGAQLLDELRGTIEKYVVLPDKNVAAAVTLWIATTHALPAFECAPRLIATSPDKRCGKTRLMDIIEGTCRRPLPTVNATVAAIFRSLGGDHPPTLIIDEADTIFGNKKVAENNEDLRALINAGHQRGKSALRCVGPNQIVTEFPTFAMVALAGIGAMPDTITDRGINFGMRRRAPGESVSQFRKRRDTPILADLRGRLSAWAAEHLDELAVAEPEMPVEDRAADTWEPLVAVADIAGGHWPETARMACKALVTAAGDADKDVSLPIKLLTDIKAVFADQGTSFLSSAVLVSNLRLLDESPWNDFDMTARKLAAKLKNFGVKSRHNTEKTTRGYHLEDLTDAFTRYLPPGVRPEASGSVQTASDQQDFLDASDEADTSKCPAENKRPRDLAVQDRFSDAWTLPDAPPAANGVPDPPSPVEFIVDHIRTHGGEREELPAADVIGAGHDAGYDERQLTNARNRNANRIGTRKAGPADGGHTGWFWYLLEPPEGYTEDLSHDASIGGELLEPLGDGAGDLFDPPAPLVCEMCGTELAQLDSIKRMHCAECHLMLPNAGSNAQGIA